LARIGDIFSGTRFFGAENYLKFFCSDFAKTAFSLRVSIEGEFYPTGREARRPFSVSTNRAGKGEGL